MSSCSRIDLNRYLLMMQIANYISTGIGDEVSFQDIANSVCIKIRNGCQGVILTYIFCYNTYSMEFHFSPPF
jgi:hypothetical protein